MAEGVTDVSTANFQQEVLEASTPVLVDFWAPWCGPCRMLAPTIEEIAKEYSGRLKVVKVNTDDAPDVANRYQVMSIPTLILFKGGQEVTRHIGLIPADQLRQLIDPHLS